MSNPLIELRHVSKQFHHRVVLHDINLTIYAHRIYGFSGPNGSGKTLTFKTILGFAKLPVVKFKSTARLFAKIHCSLQASVSHCLSTMYCPTKMVAKISRC